MSSFLVESIDPLLPLLELDLFQDMLSLRLSELIDEGVDGSSVCGIGGGDLGALVGSAGGRGPWGFLNVCSSKIGTVIVARSPPVLDRLSPSCSKPPFGSDEDKNGDMLDFSGSLNEDESEELMSGVSLMRLAWWTVLLLRSDGSWITSSYLLSEKNVLLDAVMGVDGVFGGRGGRELTSSLPEDFRPLGILIGPMVSGGSVRGASCFLACPPKSFSPARVGTKALFLALGRLRTLTASGCAKRLVLLPLLWRLVVSLPTIDFFFSVK